MTSQPPMSPARRADFAGALSKQLSEAAQTQMWPKVWRCVKLMDKLVADLKGAAAYTPELDDCAPAATEPGDLCYRAPRGYRYASVVGGSFYHLTPTAALENRLPNLAACGITVDDVHLDSMGAAGIMRCPACVKKTVSPSLKDPGRVEGPGPPSIMEGIARALHAARFNELSATALEARWAMLSKQEYALYWRMAEAALATTPVAAPAKPTPKYKYGGALLDDYTHLLPQASGGFGAAWRFVVRR